MGECWADTIKLENERTCLDRKMVHYRHVLYMYQDGLSIMPSYIDTRLSHALRKLIGIFTSLRNWDTCEDIADLLLKESSKCTAATFFIVIFQMK